MNKIARVNTYFKIELDEDDGSHSVSYHRSEMVWNDPDIKSGPKSGPKQGDVGEIQYAGEGSAFLDKVLNLAKQDAENAGAKLSAGTIHFTTSLDKKGALRHSYGGTELVYDVDGGRSSGRLADVPYEKEMNPFLDKVLSVAQAKIA